MGYFTKDKYYGNTEANDASVIRYFNWDNKTLCEVFGGDYFYIGKPDYIKRVEQRATAVIMARQLKKGVFHGI